jgi:single-strand DNA-binding protein
METVKNKVQLTGKIGKLCDFRKLDSGKKLARLSLGTTESYLSKGEMVYKTEWHNLFAWGKVAEEMEKECQSGIRIAVEGKLVSRSYNDKEGKKKYVTEVEVKEYQVIEKEEAMSHLE